MKDSYGGTFMIYLFLIFFVIYFSVICIALDFAKLYRIKNNVINILEQNQYDGSNSGSVYDELKVYLKNAHYNVDTQNINLSEKCPCSGDAIVFRDELGVCVLQKGNDKKHYYSITVYHYVSLPVLDINLPITASGETTVIN